MKKVQQFFAMVKIHGYETDTPGGRFRNGRIDVSYADVTSFQRQQKGKGNGGFHLQTLKVTVVLPHKCETHK